MRTDLSIYLAGPLFTLAQIDFNKRLANLLRTYGYTVVLPQETCAVFYKNGALDRRRTSRVCEGEVLKNDVIVGNLDGEDSGTIAELFIALTAKKLNAFYGNKLVIGFCTMTPDILQSSKELLKKGKLQLSAMTELLDDIIYRPCFQTSIEELAELIHQRIQEYFLGKK